MRRRILAALALAPLLALTTAGCTSMAPPPAPTTMLAPSRDEQVAQLLSGMTLEAKVAQLIMPDISTITPDDVRAYRFGSILNGGNSGPGGNDQAPAPEWLALADVMWEAAMEPLPAGQPVIPMLWATDAVHGHANVPGATIFPHNIALGATRDPELVRAIGAATAAEIAATGIDWTFAPTLAVATDDRWGRTYESFGEDPALVSQLGVATILGLQGEPGTPGYLGDGAVLATAKHFFGDGGTGGLDRGDTRGDLAQLQAFHGAPYSPAFAVGVQTVMASFSSVNGQKMHGSEPLLTGYLRGELGFGGLVVGDWNGHGELLGCSNSDCPEALLAGLDIFMVPEDWRALHASLLAQVRDGTIPMQRLDEAVGRVLRVKLAYGAFERPRPSARALAGRWSLIGSVEHRELARAAVRQSLVLLKNEGVLPIAATARVLVAGPGADSVPMQAGGWSISWQGGGALTNADFLGATSIHAGIAQALAAGGGAAQFSADGAFTQRPDVAVVVFGEEPYAEFVGDRDDLALRDEAGLELLRRFDAQGIPTVAVLLSGRPLWTARELALADAFVAAWLPGSEGQGVADVLVGDAAGTPRFDFAGRLAFGWPAHCAPGPELLAPFGFGGSYGAPPVLPPLDTACALLHPDMSDGLAVFGRRLASTVTAEAGNSPLANLVGSTASGSLGITAFDIAAQEDGRRLVWRASETLALRWQPRAFPHGGAVVLRYRGDAAPQAPVVLTATGTGASIDLTASFVLGAGKGWRNLAVPLACLGGGELTGLTLSSGAPFTFELAALDIVPQATDQDCEGPF